MVSPGALIDVLLDTEGVSMSARHEKSAAGVCRFKTWGGHPMVSVVSNLGTVVCFISAFVPPLISVR